MSDPGEPASPLSKYATRGALIYYALVLPAIIAEAVFSVAIASTPGALVADAASYGSVLSAAVQVLPLAILAASAYAVFSFRPSVLVALLISSFLLAVSVANGIVFLGTQLDLRATVILVVAATYLALAGFNYARGVKLLGERRPDVRSSGPFGYNVLGIALESAVPLAAALALVLLVEAVVGDLGVQAALLPQPLSTLASLYLQTRIGLVFTTLFVAGGAIWVMRQIVEPLILNFTLSAPDARKELLSELEPTTKTVNKIARYRPSGGLSWGVLTVAYSAGIIAAMAIFLPRGEFFRDLLATLNLQPPAPSPLELLIQSSIQNGLLKADILFAQSQDYVRELVRVLWG
jgi:hypothetical protein